MTSLPLIASVRLTQAYAAAHANALWAPLEQILREQSAGDQSLDPALRDSILLITILVAFLESPAQRWRPLQPAVVMRFGGIEG
jgi:hypothetical protein